MLETYSDYEIISMYKKEINQKKCLEVLYIKYLPLIKKFARKISYNGRNYDEVNNFKQDAFFEILKCVNSVKLDKIPTAIIDKWKLSCRYKYYLMRLVKFYYIHNPSFKINTEVYYSGLLVDTRNYEDIAIYKNLYSIITQPVISSTVLTDKDKQLFFARIDQDYTFEQLRKIFKVAGSDYFLKKSLKVIKQNINIEHLREYYV